MGFFDSIKSKISSSFGGSNSDISTTNVETQVKDVKPESIIDLRKRKVGIVLEKLNISEEKATIIQVLDVSGSTHNIYANGMSQNIVERMYPIAARLSITPIMPVVSFSGRADMLTPVSEKNISGYVNREIVDNKSITKWGNTRYEEALSMVRVHVANKVKPGTPVLILFYTDGEPSNASVAESTIRAMAAEQIFIQFVGLRTDGCTFSFLKKMDEMEGRVVDNANFFEASDYKNLTDEQLYEALLKEFPDWLKKARKLNILSSIR
jgi:hypothetical protein